MPFGAEQRLNDEPLHRGASGKQKDRCGNDRHIGVNPEVSVQQIHRIQAYHQELAMGEIDHPDNSENKRQAYADDGQRATEQQAVQKKLDENFHGLRPPASERIREAQLTSFNWITGFRVDRKNGLWPRPQLQGKRFSAPRPATA
ncbi:hypothetical protein D3C81_1759000 [compost metagenome]